MPDTIRPPPLATAVAAHLEGLILEGVLRPGDRLAPERDLAETLGVSRPSLREALQILEGKGLLASSRAGTVVAQFLAPLSEPLAGLFGRNERIAADYFEYRRLIEPQAAALAASRITPPERAALEECLARMRAAHEAGDGAAEAAADTSLHLLIHEACHNLVLLHVLRVFSDLLRRGILYSHEQFWQRDAVRGQILAQHEGIGAAILKGEAAAAEAAMRDHILFSAGIFGEFRMAESRLTETLRKQDRKGLVIG